MDAMFQKLAEVVVKEKFQKLLYNGKVINKNKEKEEYIYTICREKKSQAESFLNKGKWNVAFELII